MNQRETLCVKDDHLVIGGCDAVSLAAEFGTPLYVMDEAFIRGMCRIYRESLAEYGPYRVLYASKAFCCKGIYRIVEEEGLGADVVSGGELYTALAAGMPADSIYFHGNNKTVEELEMAVENGVHAVVLDCLDEIGLLDHVADSLDKEVGVLVRVNPGVEAHTHHYIQTAKPDSKFGFNLAAGLAEEAVGAVLKTQHLRLLGLHAHIGSQIFDKKPFVLALHKLTDFMKEIREKFGVDCEELNLGGGFGIWYSEEDRKIPASGYAEYTRALAEALDEDVREKKLKRPVLVIEPGRSIVGEAGVTLYTVGAVKEIPGIRKYVSVDGGMFDNPRFALYQAKYSAALANRMNDKAEETVTIAGKCCESGDMLAVDVRLPKAERGDTLAVFSTGAYNYSMASNYNRNAVPPVVLVCDGRADLLVKPQSYEDLVRNDVIPARLQKAKR